MRSLTARLLLGAGVVAAPFVVAGTAAVASPAPAHSVRPASDGNILCASVGQIDYGFCVGQVYR